MSADEYTPTTEVVRDILRRGNVVNEWPDDEALAYSDNGGFTAGLEAVERIRINKIVAAVRAEVEAQRDVTPEQRRALIDTMNRTRWENGDRAGPGTVLGGMFADAIIAAGWRPPAAPATEEGAENA